MDPNIWDDPDFDECDNPDVFLLYFYYCCNPQCHSLTGIYRPAGDRQILARTRLSPTRLGDARKKLASLRKVVFWRDWVWVVGKGNHSLFSPQQVKGAAAYLPFVPKHLAQGFYDKYRHRFDKYGINRVCIGYAYPMIHTDTSESDTVTETVSEGGGLAKSPPPPKEPESRPATPEEIRQIFGDFLDETKPDPAAT